MKPLSALDALFLHLETDATPMHVGAAHLVERPRGGGDFLLRVRRHVAQRLHLSPVFTSRLETMPLGLANPVWVRADEVDLDHHVVRVRLPRPGTLAQFEATIARLHAQPLDRSRPLWRFHVIEGLADGDFGFYTKIHHATLDGAAGVALAHALLDVTPAGRDRQPPGRALPGEPAGGDTAGRSSEPARRRQRNHPSLVALVGTALKKNSTQTVSLVRQLPALTRVAAKLAVGSTGFARQFAFGPRTPFNQVIDGGRRFATASLPLADVRRIAAAHDATVNDVVLAIISGALRRYLKALGGVPRRSLVAALPVSLREAGNVEATTLATMTLASLATTIDDPLERLRAIRSSTSSAKAVTRALKGVIPTDFPSLGLPWLLTAAASLYGRTSLADRLPPLANLVVSNVPGPAAPLYLAGGRLKTWWPLSIVEHGLGLNITLQSYAGSLDFGIVAARAGMPDVRRLARGLQPAFAELQRMTPTAT